LQNTDKYRIYEDVEQFSEFFLEIINEKSIFLIKGSNGVGLHKLLNKI
jgi:UDP-N-acetylmuramyl pentapeptide synthase